MCNFDINTETEITKSHDIDTISIVSSISDLYICKIVAILFLGTQTPPTILVIEG